MPPMWSDVCRYRGRSAGVARVLIALSAAVSAASGCGGQLSIPPKVELINQAPPYRYTDADWEAVLRKHNRDGLVDYRALSSDRLSIDRYYALLSITGPTSTPDQFPNWPHRAAYWINAYNALVIEATLSRYPVSTMYDVALPNLEYDYSFRVDGRVYTLAAIQNEILRETSGAVRALLATARAAMGGPRLPSAPIRPAGLDRQLTAIGSAALSNPHILHVDHQTQSILLWQELFSRREELVQYWRSNRRMPSALLFNVLLDMAPPKQQRDLQTGVGYPFRQADFDRRLNVAGTDLDHRTIP